MKDRPLHAGSALARRLADPPISWLMQRALDQPSLISLAAGFTDAESLPIDDVRSLASQLLRSPASGRPALQYGSTPGDPDLRRLTAQRLRRLDAALAAPESVYDPNRLLITHGSQQMLSMAAQCLCDPGDIVLVEDPTYFVFLGLAQALDIRCLGIRLTPHGLDPAHLDQVLRRLHRSGELPRVKWVYSIGYYQNPTGATLAFAAKSEALQLLRHHERKAGHPLFWLEDAAYREMRFTGEDVPSSIAVPGAADRVIYVGTYTKPFATGLRVGFGLLPPSIYPAFRHWKGHCDFGTATFLQALLRDAIASGRYDRHLPRLQARYAAKARAATSALRACVPPAIRYAEPQGGMYLWLRLPPSSSTSRRSRIFRDALAQGVLYVPGDLCYADDPSRRRPRHEIRLSYGNATEQEIREGVARLGKVFQKALA
ncbi:MAG TPA: PLP-dependent aminotransferase family protein [Candidatus Paceibacterota bacterium]|nr:PLP-dependent aminotransferase family protein [Verrucomicrobiota bacterium]HRZ44662.1 PLP-dependent aminotransferase family protein [Candidatus Paceibacterota bacterium]